MNAPTTRYHLRPPAGWLNDPNGMTRIDGRWHVFYQHNPEGPRHNAIAWGHASSEDLADWTDHGVAFGPTPGGPDRNGCWSGCYMPGLSAPVVAYTGIESVAQDSNICVRRGSDDLVTWGDPVVVGVMPGEDDVTEMRDPFVFTHGGRRWALMGASRAGGRPAVLLYNADDELSWTYEGLFATSDDPGVAGSPEADIWECPQLVELDDRWGLILSTQLRGQLNEVIAVVGDVVTDNDERPQFVAESVHLFDTGTDFYAPQAVNLPGEAPCLMGWVRQADQNPAVRDHAGCLTLPRRLHLQGAVIASRVDDIAAAALAPSAVEMPIGELSLEDRRVRIILDLGTATLTHPDLGTVPLAAGDQVWADGAVVELYPATGVPATWRHDVAWTFTLPEGSTASLSEVAHQLPIELSAGERR